MLSRLVYKNIVIYSKKIIKSIYITLIKGNVIAIGYALGYKK